MTRVAIFDLDKTLTRCGCFLPFVLFVARRKPSRWLAAPRLLAAGAALGLRLADRDAVKLLIWRKVLKGVAREEAEALGEAFAREWAATALRPKTRAVLERHVGDGNALMLATAAMDIVAEPFGRALGFEHVVATRTAWTAEGRVADRFDGLNCYGEEKLRRVQAAMPPGAEAIAAYSDHVTDLPLLAWATRGVAVNPHPPLAAAAATHDIEVQDWGVAPKAARD